jgi:hypothetical protein
MINKYIFLTIVYIMNIGFLIGAYYFMRWYVNHPPKKENLLKRWKTQAKSFNWALRNFWILVFFWLLSMINVTRVLLKILK